MKIFFLCFQLLISSFYIFAQTPTATICNPPIPYVANNSEWGADFLVSASEPLGRSSATYQTTNNTIWVSVPDTIIMSGKCVLILKSTNNGLNWAITNYVTPASVIPKTKMVSQGDSVYCFLLFGTTVYCYNIITGIFNPFTTYTNIRDFDVTISSTKSLYLITDILGNNDVRLFGSSNGGVSWGYANYVSSAGAFPGISMSGSGDTAMINYYGTITPDTISSKIRSVRYRETTAGTMAVTGSFTDPIAAGTPKDQFLAVKNQDKVWLFYTTGTTGGIDLNCIISTDYGVTFGTPVTVSSSATRDEYWFDAKCYSGGVDVIFYSDSLQSGSPTNQSDKLIYCYALNGSPGTFQGFNQISQKPPGWSVRNYIPTLFENSITGDAGVIWVGQDGANRKLYFDRFNAVSGINPINENSPDNFVLKQNYPNPFNPETQIEFSVPKNEFVTISIFDMAGREVQTMVKQQLTRGSYSVTFNGSSLSSGVYFYKMTAGSYSETKKMMLVK